MSLKISILTVVKNGEKYLEETIKSVISQDYNNFEYIIIDGASTDSTINIIEKYKNNIDFYISEEDQGQTDALIKGFKYATGDIYCWLNYDDMFFDATVLQSVANIFSSTEIDLIYGNDLLVDQFGMVIKERKFNNWCFSEFLYGLSISQPSTFFSKHTYDAFGLNKSLDYSMDLDFFIKVFFEKETFYINKYLSRNRIHSARKMIADISSASEESKRLRLSIGANKRLYLMYSIFFRIRRKILHYI